MFEWATCMSPVVVTPDALGDGLASKKLAEFKDTHCKELDEVKANFIAKISKHATPLRAIQGFGEKDKELIKISTELLKAVFPFPDMVSAVEEG